MSVILALIFRYSVVMSQIIVIAHNLRSSHNVGSLLRTAEGLGIQKIYLTGYTPYPKAKGDARLPHLATKIDAQIHKTALGSEKYLDWQHSDDITAVINELRGDKYQIVALEQARDSIALAGFKAPPKLALIIGREVEGIEPEVLELADTIVEIPMRGQKESFNVVQAAAMVLYQLTNLA